MRWRTYSTFTLSPFVRGAYPARIRHGGHGVQEPDLRLLQQWIEHMQANGFTVKAQNVADIMPYKSANGVPLALGSCHTAKVDGYVIEGHVPAADIKRLLKERPKVLGLAVPGMPVGSPGMEQGAHKERYDVLTFDNAGNTSVYARH